MVQEEEYTPTEKQEATMRGLCRELGLSFQQEVKQLTSQEAYSNKIGELLKQKKEKKAHDQAVSKCSQWTGRCALLPLWFAACLPACLLACLMICLPASCTTGAEQLASPTHTCEQVSVSANGHVAHHLWCMLMQACLMTGWLCAD